MCSSDRKENIEMQLSEIEMLLSMYPDEMVLHDEFLVSELKENTDPKQRIEFTVDVNLDLNEKKYIVEIFVIFPLDYPSCSLPEITIRSNYISRSKQQILNEKFKSMMCDLEIGDLCMFNIIEWIQENVNEDYVEIPTIVTEEKPIPSSGIYSRLWIYSHHIYSKTKRKNILEWSKELNLSGFSMPGKPGVVCVEGPQELCEEFWQRNKRQTWKRLCVILREELDKCSTDLERNNICKFGPLEEKDFGVHGGRNYHMDLGKFADFLNEHNSKHVFRLIFGVEGNSAIHE